MCSVPMKAQPLRAAAALALLHICAGVSVRARGAPVGDPALVQHNSSGPVAGARFVHRQASNEAVAPVYHAASNQAAPPMVHAVGTQARVNNGNCRIPVGMMQVQTRAGFPMVVLSSGDIVSQELARTGMWDIAQPSDLTVPGMPFPPPGAGAFLDLGGNIGYFSLLFAHHGYSALTAEPMARNNEALEASLCLNPHLRQRITVFPVALVSPEETSMKCIITSGLASGAMGHPEGNGKLTCGSAQAVGPCGSGCQVVPVKTLDTMLAEANVAAISVVKMDIEAHECKVLAGGSSLFKRYRPKVLRAETAYSGWQCFQEAASAHGYDLHRMGGETIITANS